MLVGCHKGNEIIEDDQGVALINAYIIDGVSNNPINNGVILFKNGIIEAVGSAESVSVPDGYLKKDLKGKTVLPGFINTHVHYAYDEKQLKKWLKNQATQYNDAKKISLAK
jgi:imidazolonepropionase-like amidohydrolase